jgi:hypothetical protein
VLSTINVGRLMYLLGDHGLSYVLFTVLSFS